MAKTDKKKIKCQGECKRELIETNFYQSNSPLFNNNNHRVNICKQCINKMINMEDINSVYMVLQALDIAFMYDYWTIAKEKNPKNPFGKYITMANSMPQIKNLRYKDSIFESINLKDENDKSDLTVKKRTKFDIEDMTHEQLEDKYGVGYTDEEYYCFEKKWRKLADSYGQKTSIHTESLTTYIRFRVKEELATAKGDVAEATKWGQLAEKAQQSGKLNVSQLSKSDISGGVDLLPQLFEAVEDKVGIIPILPKVKEQPYDDADLIIWAIIEYTQRLEGKPRIEYKDIWSFYDDMLIDFYKQKGFTDEQIEEERVKRNAIFRDLSDVYKEPIYDEGDC